MKNKTTLDMSAILDSYTQEVIKENKRRQAIRDAAQQQQEWFAKWNEASYGTWNISDRDWLNENDSNKQPLY